MNIKQAIVTSLGQADAIVGSYLGDLTQEELLVRAVPGSNHIAWQLGHLISSERYLVDKAAPGKMEALPAGFAERHSKAAAVIDDPKNFSSKAEYLALAKKVRANTLRALDGMTDAALDGAVSGVPPFIKTAGEVFLFTGPHWLMHAGQWAIIRRKLGRPPLF